MVFWPVNSLTSKQKLLLVHVNVAFILMQSVLTELQVLASFINPGGLISKEFEPVNEDFVERDEDEDANDSSLPALLPDLLTQSCLVPALSSYLRNDSGEYCTIVTPSPLMAVRSFINCH